jgi:hypothetical protein
MVAILVYLTIAANDKCFINILLTQKTGWAGDNALWVISKNTCFIIWQAGPDENGEF